MLMAGHPQDLKVLKIISDHSRPRVTETADKGDYHRVCGGGRKKQGCGGSGQGGNEAFPGSL